MTNPIETHVVADVDRRAFCSSIRGMKIPSPASAIGLLAATFDQLEAGVNRAHDEVARVDDIADRYRRRFGHPNEDGAHTAQQRLLMRFEIARSIAQQRSEVLRLLTEVPAAGSA
jgi:hypothetical protein